MPTYSERYKRDIKNNAERFAKITASGFCDIAAIPAKVVVGATQAVIPCGDPGSNHSRGISESLYSTRPLLADLAAKTHIGERRVMAAATFGDGIITAVAMPFKIAVGTVGTVLSPLYALVTAIPDSHNQDAELIAACAREAALQRQNAELTAQVRGLTAEVSNLNKKMTESEKRHEDSQRMLMEQVQKMQAMLVAHQAAMVKRTSDVLDDDYVDVGSIASMKDEKASASPSQASNIAKHGMLPAPPVTLDAKAALAAKPVADIPSITPVAKK